MNYRSRDHSRTPMQWRNSSNADFTSGEPWLSVNENYPEINVGAARSDESSIWHHYRTLIDLRHAEDVLVYGKYNLLCPDDDQIYAYTRTLADERMLIVLNWSEEPATFVADVNTANVTALYSNYSNAPSDPNRCELRPYEALVYRI